MSLRFAITCVLMCGIVLAMAGVAFGYGWTALTSPASQTLNGVWFTSPSTGWAVGRGSAAYKTTDGGATWAPVVLPAGVPPTLAGVAFADEDHGWISADSGVVYYTNDGGESWTESNVGVATSLKRPFALDAAHVWIPAPGFSGRVFRSNGGPTTWAAGVVPGEETMSAVAFADALNGFAVGYFGSAYRSGDGGQTWASVVPGGFNSHLTDVSVVDSQTAIAVSGLGHITRTSDRGESWSTQQLADTYLYACDWRGDGEVWAAGIDAFLHSRDGGATWTKVGSVPGGFGIYDMQFPDASTGYAVGDSGVLMKYTAPAAPSLSDQVTKDASSIDVSWGASADAESYEYRIGSGSIVPTALTTVNVTPLDLGETAFSVRAVTSEGLYSPWVSARIINNEVALAKPALIAPTVVNAAQAAVTWSAVADAVSYEYRLNGGTVTTTTNRNATIGPLNLGANVIEVRAIANRSAGAWGTKTVTYVVPKTQSLVLTRTPSSLTYKATAVTLGGTTGGHTIQAKLEQRVGSGAWVDTGVRITSSASGVLPSTVRATRANTSYRLTFGGSPYWKPATSNTVSVTYKPLLKTPSVPSVKANRSFTTKFSAYTPLKNSGAKVKFRYYRWTGKSWKLSKTVTAKQGAFSGGKTVFSAKVKLTRKGTWRVKASYDGGALYADGSQTKKFRAK